MSSVSGIGGNAQSIYQFIQSLSGNTSTPTSSTAGSTTSSVAQTISQAAQGIGQALQNAGGHHHHHGALKQIQDAVTNALQSAQASGSNSDPNTIVEDAIAQVLGNNNAAVSSTSGSNESTSPTINTQNFYQTLQSYGVTPQQFQQDLLSAVKDAQTGTVSNGTAFQNFALGGTLNTLG